MKRKHVIAVSASVLSAGLIAGIAMADSKRWESRFDRLDSNKDGKITAEEMDAFRSARFKAADRNGDGAISLAEHKAAVLARMEDRIAKHYARMDKNGDGRVTADEYGRKKRSFFERLDRDKDGAISREEAEKAAKRHKRHKRRDRD